MTRKGQLDVKTILTLTLCTAALTNLASAEEWSAWRGPRGDGISHESEVPVTWSSTENIAWKTQLPGKGRSSPIAWRDRVFITAGDDADQSRRVVCCDAATGAILWNVPVHHGAPGDMHKFNTSASSTPPLAAKVTAAACQAGTLPAGGGANCSSIRAA